MFTGIVETTGEVLSISDSDDGRRLRLSMPFTGVETGQSISVSGACLTVEAFSDGEWIEVFLAEETLDRTFFDTLDVGDRLNLERAMPADGRFDGHIVQGHVDATGEITAIERAGESTGDVYDGDWTFTFSVPADHREYLVEKGSITIDGVSLTVADCTNDGLSVAIIPTTYNETTLSEKSVGDPVHLEFDVIAKYVEQLC
jgi:riboflavin synthase